MNNTLAEAIAKIEPADSGAMRRAQSRQRNLTKPPGSLGRLEDVSIQLAGIFQTERPEISGKAVIVAAGDHGVVAQGVTGYPQEVTAQMVLNFLSGGAAVSVMSRQLGVRQIIVDARVSADLPQHPDLRVVKIGRGTNDMTSGPAMTREQAEEAVLAGVNLAIEAAEASADLIATAKMRRGNTTASSAIA
ncbi:MAG: nicotinate-nucleotide--dimethylbenzimidazole phosphoribosyltransferase, partial [Chloroflexi bacterium]|nr:nicotinate-nucleotide--dimethylbenzimidazole phosphoribosyltransferase [Chloroflexota bacterium]